MSGVEDLLPELRFSDVRTFLAVRRCGSITSAARELRVTPSQVSKAISRLEAQLRLNLLVRSARGVTLSDQAERVTPHFEEVMGRLRLVAMRDADATPELAVAAPSYMLASFLPVIAQAQPNLRLRGVQLAPALIRSFSTHSLFDVALATDVERLPSTWVGEPAGRVRKSLFSTRAVARALGPSPVSPERLKELPFIIPIYIHNDHHVPVDDGCPLPVSDRKVGHEVQTIALALDLAATSSQLAFGPVIAASRHLADGRLVEIEVEGWEDVDEPLYVACNADRVTSRVHRAIVAAVSAALADAGQSRS
ncbi:MAG: LysR family transcriptional regulator [Myxococcaceae bacterium]